MCLRNVQHPMMILEVLRARIASQIARRPAHIQLLSGGVEKLYGLSD
jgi:hypothetical protein